MTIRKETGTKQVTRRGEDEITSFDSNIHFIGSKCPQKYMNSTSNKQNLEREFRTS